MSSTIQSDIKNDNPNLLKKENNLKELFIIFSLLLASFISVFGVYNTFDFSLIYFIQHIESTSERIANYSLLVIFTITMFIMSTIYWKKKDFFSKMQILGFLVLILIIMVGIMAIWIHNFLYPFFSLIILGTTFFLFNMLFNTIGLVGVFFSVSLFSVLLVFILKIGIGTSASGVFIIIQTFLSFLLFLGTTFPRIRSLLFKIGTRDNVEFDNGLESSDSDLDE